MWLRRRRRRQRRGDCIVGAHRRRSGTNGSSVRPRARRGRAGIRTRASPWGPAGTSAVRARGGERGRGERPRMPFGGRESGRSTEGTRGQARATAKTRRRIREAEEEEEERGRGRNWRGEPGGRGRYFCHPPPVGRAGTAASTSESLSSFARLPAFIASSFWAAHAALSCR